MFDSRKWVSTFNAYPTDMIETLIRDHPDEWEVEGIPMWGTMWAFDDWVDQEWLENYDGLEIMRELGFILVHHEEWGYFFGIDGAGFDFFESYWTPLFKKRLGERNE